MPLLDPSYAGLRIQGKATRAANPAICASTAPEVAGRLGRDDQTVGNRHAGGADELLGDVLVERRGQGRAGRSRCTECPASRAPPAPAPRGNVRPLPLRPGSRRGRAGSASSFTSSSRPSPSRTTSWPSPRRISARAATVSGLSNSSYRSSGPSGDWPTTGTRSNARPILKARSLAFRFHYRCHCYCRFRFRSHIHSSYLPLPLPFVPERAGPGGGPAAGSLRGPGPRRVLRASR